MEVPLQVMSIGVTLGLAGAGIIVGALRWSIIRNIDTLDKKMEEVKDTVVDLSRAVSDLRAVAVTTSECIVCRRECSERTVQYQQDIIQWMRRQEDKSDRLLMMVANINNGMGGVKNGLKE